MDNNKNFVTASSIDNNKNIRLNAELVNKNIGANELVIKASKAIKDLSLLVPNLSQKQFSQIMDLVEQLDAYTQSVGLSPTGISTSEFGTALFFGAPKSPPALPKKK